MKLFICAIFSLLPLVAARDASALQISAYEVQRNGTPVGRGLMSVDVQADKTVVTYRMNIVVKLMYVPVYRLDSQQIAVFDKDNKLVAAKTSADIDGDKHEATFVRKGDELVITHNGQTKKVPITEYVATTLDPIFLKPQTGKWLDLTDSDLIPYTVEQKEGFVHLTRPNGTDNLYHDSSGMLERGESSIKRGALLMRRIAAGEAARQAVSLPDRVQAGDVLQLAGTAK